jgi:hypothetical protein
MKQDWSAFDARNDPDARLEQVRAAERAATIEECAGTQCVRCRDHEEHPIQQCAAYKIRALPHDRSALDTEIERATKPLREKIARLQAVIDSLGRVATEAINTAVANALNERAEQKA